MSKPVCVIWMKDWRTYEKHLDRAGLADRFEIHGYGLDDTVPDDVAARAEVLMAYRPGTLLKRMPKLRWIQAMNAGVDPWLNSPDLRADVTLCCARGSHRIPMPENILGALFHITKPYMQCALDQRESRWNKRMSVPLAGKTLGILGLGAIGQEVARKAKALEMRIVGTKRNPAPLPNVDEVYGPDATDEVLRQADFLVLLIPSTKETQNIIDASRLKLMKPTAWLINFGRGALIVDDDLIAAVESKTIAGAILDVFRQEPLPETHRFWKTDGILVLPHIGGGHPQRNDAVAEIFADNARRFLDGTPLQCVVDRSLGY
jgi:phosphoglycerate dehydrogenase-like enzyme